MKIIPFIIPGLVWTSALWLLYTLPSGTQIPDRRLPFFLVISWILGLVLIVRVVRDRKKPGAKGLIITIDESTGLANRLAFQGHVEPLLGAAIRFEEKSLVVVLNINNLDRIIKEDGDAEAEGIVIQVAQAFLNSLRASDILARYDKDELVAFLPKATMEFSGRVTQRINMNLDARRDLIRNPQDLNVSVGYSEFDPVAPQSLDYLIRQAYEDMIRSMGENNKEIKDQI